MESKILHVDMDAFFASVEVLDNPNLKGKAIIVGGGSDRGVVTTCSYEARKYGVKSAMPGFQAKAICPNGIFLPVRHSRYKEVSTKVFNLLYSITDKIEQVSIDEAYIDISDLEEDPKDIAIKIKNMVFNEVGLTLSVGISYNKFLAKIASDWKKPSGLMEIKRDEVKILLGSLNISKVHGLGRKAVKKLNNIGIYSVNDMYELSKDICEEYFGKQGSEIYDRIRGIDNRKVITTRERKSIGKETTLKIDTKKIEELKEYLNIFSSSLENYLIKNNLKAKTITLKLKDIDFINHSKSKTFNSYLKNQQEIFSESINLLNETTINKKIRLIGLSLSSLESDSNEQLSLFD